MLLSCIDMLIMNLFYVKANKYCKVCGLDIFFIVCRYSKVWTSIEIFIGFCKLDARTSQLFSIRGMAYLLSL